VSDPGYGARGTGELPTVAAATTYPELRGERTAVVVVDMVNWQVSPDQGMLGRMAANGVDISYMTSRVRDVVVPNVQRLVAHLRRAGGRIVYLRVGAYQHDCSDGSPHLQPSLRAAGAYDGSWACAVIDELSPEPGDISLIKTGSGGFASSNLDGHLRNMGIEHVLYTGVATSGCVLLTLAGGWDLGYHGYLVTDATATFSERLQEVTEELVSGYLAQVVTTDDLVARLAR
jgi:nicotinamidase-related amidase